jgi:DNA-binding transcriptional LysR family regulator
VERMHMLNVFVAVGETQGFAAAAQRMRLSPAAVTRAIAGLEKTLGVELLQRTTRNVRLTEAGEHYLNDIRQIVTQIDSVNDACAAAPKGHLVVAASESFGNFFVLPCLLDYLQRYPQVDAAACFVDRDVNIVDDGVDVAIGIGSLRDPGLIATTVGQVRYVLCAAPSYLDRRGAPLHPGDLLHHAIISIGPTPQPVAWKFDGPDGRMTMHLRARMNLTTEDDAIAAAVLGLGVVRLMSYHASELIEQGRLRPVLASYTERYEPVHVLRRERGCGVPKVSQFVQLLVERLGADPRLR